LSFVDTLALEAILVYTLVCTFDGNFLLIAIIQLIEVIHVWAQWTGVNFIGMFLRILVTLFELI
jgi:hypothetical protein